MRTLELGGSWESSRRSLRTSGFWGRDSEQKEYTIDKEFIMKELKDHFAKSDLRRYML